MRISDWSSDVCSSDLGSLLRRAVGRLPRRPLSTLRSITRARRAAPRGLVRPSVPCGSSCAQRLGMPAQMLCHERPNEVVAVIIAWLQTQFQVDPCILARLRKQGRLKLLVEEDVAFALVDQNTQNASTSLDKAPTNRSPHDPA